MRTRNSSGAPLGNGIGGTTSNGVKPNGTSSSTASLHKAEAEAMGAWGRYQTEWNAAFAAIHALGVTLLSIVFVFGYLLIR